MKVHNNLCILFLGLTITLISLCAETPQLSYWQQFKNWVKTYFPPHQSSIKTRSVAEFNLIKKEIEGLSKEEKILRLQQMRNHYSLEGKNPDEFKLNAVAILLNLLSTKKNSYSALK